MRALILGAGGQVGRALLRTAPPGVTPIGLTRADCDVIDRAALAHAVAQAKPAFVVNASAYTAVDRAEAEPDAAAALNARAPGDMAAIARAAGAGFVHISTDFVFGEGCGRPRLPDEPTSPVSVYGRTKRDGEVAALRAHPEALVVRTAWVHSANGQNFMLSLLRLLGEREELRVVADQVGTPTYADGLASAIWALAAAGHRGIRHFTDAGTASRYDFAVAIQEEALALGLLARPARIVPIRSEDFAAAACRPHHSVLDKDATWALLGGPAPHWRENLRRCLAEVAGNG